MTNKSATEVLTDAIFSSVLDAISALKSNAGGVPNALLRDINSIHDNCTIDTLPQPVQKAIQTGVQETLKRLQREGYSVVGKAPVRVSTPVRRNRV